MNAEIKIVKSVHSLWDVCTHNKVLCSIVKLEVCMYKEGCLPVIRTMVFKDPCSASDLAIGLSRLSDIIDKEVMAEV